MHYKIVRLGDEDALGDSAVFALVDRTLLSECSQWTENLGIKLGPSVITTSRRKAIGSLAAASRLVFATLTNAGSAKGEEAAKARMERKRQAASTGSGMPAAEAGSGRTIRTKGDIRSKERARNSVPALKALVSAEETLMEMTIHSRALLEEHIRRCKAILGGDLQATYSDTAWNTLIPTLFRDDSYCQTAYKENVSAMQERASLAASKGLCAPPTTYLLDNGSTDDEKWARVRETFSELRSRIQQMEGMSEHVREKMQEDVGTKGEEFSEKLRIWAASVKRDATDEGSFRQEMSNKYNELCSHGS